MSKIKDWFFPGCRRHQEVLDAIDDLGDYLSDKIEMFCDKKRVEAATKRIRATTKGLNEVIAANSGAVHKKEK